MGSCEGVNTFKLHCTKFSRNKYNFFKNSLCMNTIFSGPDMGDNTDKISPLLFF